MEPQLPADIVVLGGVSLTVQVRATQDGKTSLQPVDVFVRLVPIKQFGEYLDSVGDMLKFVKLVTGKDDQFVESLVDDSLYTIDDKAKELNDPRIGRYLNRQKATVESVKPLASQVSELISSSPKS